MILAVLWTMRNLADRWLYPTPLLYIPRVGWLIPLALLALLTLALRRFRLLPAQAAVALVIAGPLMNLNLPLWSLLDRPTPGDHLRVLTLNRAVDRVHLDRLEQLVRAERILQPVNVRRGRVAVGLDHVEAARRTRVLAVFGEERLRGQHQPAALGGIDRGRAAAECGRAPVADFDEHEAVAVAHHQVEFAAAVVRVRGDFAQASAKQVRACGGFRLPAARRAVSHRRGSGRPRRR